MATLLVRQLNGLLLALGYTEPLVSLQQLSSRPNFPVIARLLGWLAERCSNCPSALGSSTSLQTEEERVTFLEQAANVFALNANFILDLECMYSAETGAVKQLIALCQTILTAVNDARDRTNTFQPEQKKPPDPVAETETALAIREPYALALRTDPPGEVIPPLQNRDRMVLATKLQQLKNARSAAFQLVETGASLVQTLERHNHPGRALHRRRVRAFLENLGLHLESGADPQQAAVQGQLESQLQNARQDLEKAQAECTHLEKEVKRANMTLTKITQDNDRVEKRLRSLEALKPAFMENYERLMAELQETYEVYVTCVRNERYLETQAQRRRREEEKEREAQQQLLQELQEKLKKEAELLVRAFDEDDSEDDEDYSQVYKEDYAQRIAPGVSFEAMLASPPPSGGDKRAMGQPGSTHPEEEQTVYFHQQRRSEHEGGQEIFSRIREKDRARRERLKRLEEEASSTREKPTAGETNSTETQSRKEASENSDVREDIGSASLKGKDEGKSEPVGNSNRGGETLNRRHCEGSATTAKQKETILSSADNSDEEEGDPGSSPGSKSSSPEDPSHRSTERINRENGLEGRAQSFNFSSLDYDEPDADDDDDELATDSADAFVSPGERRLRRQREYMQTIEDSLF
ncbi:clusterin-associated protein 1 [Cystoisospora suis]|uniref:Clusterin-associated protein 1 n=1 Tax=Cystoisospora suis TaxID=483139 RepID=A0A2C6L283_9APIC|nr:clusterin-associated protein 1 [Cystoisospora suis]